MKDQFTLYDLQAITALSKKRNKNIILQAGFYAVIFALSVLITILLSEYLFIFILCIIASCITAFMCIKQFRKISFADCSSAKGEIADVFKEITTLRSITGGYGMYITRKYDAFAKPAIRLTVSLKENNKIQSYVLNGVTEEHAKYYETKGEAIHIWGTHFPVKLDIGKEKWLCPVCGEFNANEEKTCARCKRKILK